MSAKEAKSGKVEGNRFYYFPKDLAQPFVDTPIKENSLIKMVHVDYYVNMNDYLWNFKPIMLYNFNPKKPCGSTNEYVWYTENDEIVMKITGGAEAGRGYRHKLWDYDVDHITLDTYTHRLTFFVETRPTSDPNHQLVLITPVAKTPLLLLYWLKIRSSPLRLKEFGGGMFKVTVTLDPHVVNLQPPGVHVSCAIPYNAFATAVLRYRHAERLKNPPLLSDFERVFISSGVKEHTLAAATFVSYMQSGRCIALPDCVVGTTDPARYHPVGSLALEDGKAAGYSGAPAILPLACLPDRSLCSDEAMKRHRIDAVASEKHEPLTSDQDIWLNEFCEHVANETGVMAGSLTAMLSSDVRDQQDRPTQKAGAKAEEHVIGADIKKATTFQKIESYPKQAPPRNITNLKPGHRIQTSAFTYPLADVLKKTRWYAFGRPPAGVADVVRRVVRDIQEVSPTDISRMDGSTNSKAELAYFKFCSYFLHPDETDEFARLRNLEIDCPARTMHGLAYRTGNTTLSGSATTSGRNSLIVAIAMYFALRKAGYTRDEAYEFLGCFGGDDGLQGHLTKDQILEGFLQFNLKAKYESIKRGCPVMFLGRVFHDPWHEDTCYADVPRTVAKLHVVTDPNVSFDESVRRKALALEITDPNTPILREWVRAVRRAFPQPLTRRQMNKTRLEASWWSKQEGPRFQPPADNQAVEVVADMFEMSPTEILGYEAYLRSVKTPEHFQNLIPIKDVSPEVAVSCTQGGTTLLVPEPEPRVAVRGKLHPRTPRKAPDPK